MGYAAAAVLEGEPTADGPDGRELKTGAASARCSRGSRAQEGNAAAASWRPGARRIGGGQRAEVKGGRWGGREVGIEAGRGWV